MAVVSLQALNRPATPRVSVCVANFNGEHMLGSCIDSILAQDSDASIEIIVHDDASTDGSIALLRERYPQALVIASEENAGFCVANNRMVAEARGEYVLLLNNDAALQPDAVRLLLDQASRSSQAAILTAPQYDWETGNLVDRGCLLDPFHTPIPNLDARLQDVAYVIGACLWIPRATWHALGGFPEWFGSIAEDMYLCCAARLRGVPVRCIDASGYRHRQGASFGGNRIGEGRLQTRYTRRYLSERNRIAILAICTPKPLALAWLGLHLAALVLEGVAVCVTSFDATPWRKIYWPAVRDSAAMRGHMLSLRRTVQAGRNIGLATYLRGFYPQLRKAALLWRHGFPEIKD